VEEKTSISRSKQEKWLNLWGVIDIGFFVHFIFKKIEKLVVGMCVGWLAIANF
jgi:hypothetical protein